MQKETKNISLMDFHKIGKNGNPYDIIDVKIADYIISQENVLIIEQKPYIYKNGVYIMDEDGTILKYLIKSMIIPDLITVTRINRVYNLILIDHKLKCDIEDVNRYPSHWINFKNGMLDVLTGEIHKHDPNYLSVNQIPHDFIPDLKIEDSLFYRFLQSRIPSKENQKMLFEYMGYCMTKDLIFQKFMILHGIGNSGKSKILNFIIKMVGKENVCNIPLQDLSERFTSANLLLKLLNTCGDLTSKALKDSSVIKQITGNDPVKAEYKGGKTFSFISNAKMIFSCNELPVVIDEKSNGFYRRLLLIRFSESGEYIHDLERNLSDEKEIEKVISGCVFALQNALERGSLFESRENLVEVSNLKMESDSAEAFMNDCVEKNENLKIKRADLYSYYEEYCREENRMPLGKQGFFKSLRLKGYSDIKNQGVYYFKGLDIKWKHCSSTPFYK